MLRRQKSTGLESISLSLECKGDIQNTGWKPFISSWTIFDAFTEARRQVILPFKNPPVSRIWMCSTHLHTVRGPAYPHPTVIHVASKPKSHSNEAPYKISHYLLDNIYLTCFSKLFRMGLCVRIIPSLQINRIFALTFQIQLLSWRKYCDYLAVHSTVKTTQICLSQIPIKGAISS